MTLDPSQEGDRMIHLVENNTIEKTARYLEDMPPDKPSSLESLDTFESPGRSFKVGP